VKVDKKEWKKSGKYSMSERTIRGLLAVLMNQEDQTLNPDHENDNEMFSKCHIEIVSLAI
jgi:hypothetical protein